MPSRIRSRSGKKRSKGKKVRRSPRLASKHSWFLALKKWNEKNKGQVWCIPKRNSPGYKEVQKLRGLPSYK